MGQPGQLDDVDSNEDELTGDEAADLAGDEAEDLAGEDDFYREMKKRKEAKQSAKAARQQYAAHYVNEDFELEEGESRKATQKILKNRGLVPSRPKENRNPRVKKRRRYEQAVKRRKGQVVPMANERSRSVHGREVGNPRRCHALPTVQLIVFYWRGAVQGGEEQRRCLESFLLPCLSEKRKPILGIVIIPIGF